MAIAALAKAAPAPYRGSCQVCQALGSIPPDEAAGLRELLSNPQLRYTAISDMIRDDPDTPLDLSANLLGKHARGQCAAGEILRPR